MKRSLRLRALTFGMRYLVKPKLARSGTPETAFRDFERVAPLLFSTPKGTTSSQDGPSLRVEVGTPYPNRAVLYLHGGAFVCGSVRSYRAMAARLAKRSKAAVFLVDYPLLQQDTFPAAPDFALAAWDHLIATGWAPHQIAIAGDSAGGNLAFGLLAQVLARGQRPAAALGFSPWGDMTLSGETITDHMEIDPLLPVGRMQEVVDLYLDGADPKDPKASPVFAQFPDPPPVLIQVGANEVLLSDCKRLAELTGATLDIWPHVPHVWQIFDARLPEANDAMRKASAFLQSSFESARR